jgi:hypothetical protein
MSQNGPSRLLPDDRATLFLRACLHDGERAQEAWEAWVRSVTADGTSVRRALVPVNAFLPLLGWNFRRCGLRFDPALQTHFRSAQLTEELRYRKYRAICSSTFGLLRDASVPFVALKGAIVGELFYPAPTLRHADDIDVLLHEEDLTRAEDLLIRSGWQRQTGPAMRSSRHLPPLMNADGVPIELHWRLTIPYYAIPYDQLWARSLIVPIADEDVRVLSPADNLLHVCAHGVSDRPDLKWVVDAWFILSSNPAFDWEIFTATTIAAKLSLPTFHAVRYLSERLGAPVPDAVLGKLEWRAARTGFFGRQAARPWPGPADGDHAGGVWGWWRRLRAVGERVFPAPVQFALHYDVRLWAVPFFYVYRLTRYLRVRRPDSRVISTWRA